MLKHPIVLLIGIVGDITNKAEGDPLIIKGYEDITIFHCLNDSNILKDIAKYQPSIIVSLGDDWKKHRNLISLPSMYKCRWIHYKTIEEMSTWKLVKCYLSIHNLSGKEIMISLFTTAYLSRDKIERAYKSLKIQTYSNWEWVIYDDAAGTDEETNRYFRRISQQDPRVRIYQSNIHTGNIGENKHVAAQLCDGDLLAEMDHDDELTPRCLELLKDAMVKYPHAGFFYTDCTEVYEKDLHSHNYADGWSFGYGSYHRMKHGNGFVDVARSFPLNRWTIRDIVGVPNHIRAWRKSTYQQLRGHNRMLPVADDYELVVRTVLSAPPNEKICVQIPFCGYLQYRNIGGNTTLTRNSEIRKLQNWVHWHHQAEINRKLELPPNAGRLPPNQQILLWEKDPSVVEERLNEIYRESGKVSIVIPSDGNPKGVVDSLLTQTYSNIEIIVISEGIDTGASVDTIMKTYSDGRLRWWHLKKAYDNKGVTRRNYGLKMVASGEHITYATDVDQWEKGHLEGMMKRLGDKEFLREGDCILHKCDLLEKHGYWRKETLDEMVKRWSQ